ncbi:50S ribosomal protein L29 [Candidatus Kaiserbacteria bacterium]|nr:50S ribosomal protein L29 [Candidatus Kaiserbacteria bacterium]USN92416.1 MAG: 50S ribosomal protein L29 [Candidatus Nomurabacteria bacterium]
MTNMQDIKKKSDAELTDLVRSARETVRQERFKDKFSRKASVIKNAKLEIARSFTELTARRRNQETK